MKEWSLNLCILLCFCCLCLCHLICWTRSASSKQSPWMASLMRLWCIMLLLVCVVVLLIWPYTFALCRENGKKTTGLKIKANGATGCCVQLVAARSCRWIAFPWQPLLLLLYPKKKKYLDDFQSWYACHHAIFILYPSKRSRSLVVIRLITDRTSFCYSTVFHAIRDHISDWRSGLSVARRDGCFVEQEQHQK